jgi:hypothetical protein
MAQDTLVNTKIAGKWMIIPQKSSMVKKLGLPNSWQWHLSIFCNSSRSIGIAPSQPIHLKWASVIVQWLDLLVVLSPSHTKPRVFYLFFIEEALPSRRSVLSAAKLIRAVMKCVFF